MKKIFSLLLVSMLILINTVNTYATESGIEN